LSGGRGATAIPGLVAPQEGFHYPELWCRALFAGYAYRHAVASLMAYGYLGQDWQC